MPGWDDALEHLREHLTDATAALTTVQVLSGDCSTHRAGDQHPKCSMLAKALLSSALVGAHSAVFTGCMWSQAGRHVAQMKAHSWEGPGVWEARAVREAPGQALSNIGSLKPPNLPIREALLGSLLPQTDEESEMQSTCPSSHSW
jgi:hypothetical protein